MSKDKSSKFRNSYEETANKRYRTKEFPVRRIIYTDFIIERGVYKYRTQWKSTFYTDEEYEAKATQKFLEYFEHDIAGEIEINGGVKIIWKDSYIPLSDVFDDDDDA